jgi:hypothetical protein
MATHNRPEEILIIKWLEKQPQIEDARQPWIDQIKATGMSEELAAAMRQHLEGPQHARLMVEFSQLVHRWRLSQGARHFTK